MTRLNIIPKSLRLGRPITGAKFFRSVRVLDELLAGSELSGQRWLDAGCGTGTLARFLAKHKGCKVLGVDASGEMISRCAVVPNTEFRQILDICETGLPEATFDGILCSSTLEYVIDPPLALREFRRVLKQNGLLLVSVPNAHPIARWPVWAVYWLTNFWAESDGSSISIIPSTAIRNRNSANSFWHPDFVPRMCALTAECAVLQY